MVALSSVSWSDCCLPPLLREMVMFSRTFSQLRHYMFPRNVPFGLMLQTCCMLYLSKAVTPLRLDDVQVDQCIWEKKVIQSKSWRHWERSRAVKKYQKIDLVGAYFWKMALRFQKENPGGFQWM